MKELNCIKIAYKMVIMGLILTILFTLKGCASKSMIAHKKCSYTPINEHVYCDEWSYSSDKLFDMLEASKKGDDISIKVESVKKQTSGLEEIGKAVLPSILEKAKLK